MKYSIKLSYFIKTWSDFWFSWLFFRVSRQHCPISENNFCLVIYIFTKPSQMVSLINTYILIYQYARCDYKLFDFIAFFCVFIHYLTSINVWSIEKWRRIAWKQVFTRFVTRVRKCKNLGPVSRRFFVFFLQDKPVNGVWYRIYRHLNFNILSISGGFKKKILWTLGPIFKIEWDLSRTKTLSLKVTCRGYSSDPRTSF